MTNQLLINEKVQTVLTSNGKAYLLLCSFSIFAGLTWPAGKIVALNLPAISAAFYRFSIALPLFFLLQYITGNVQKIKRGFHVRMAVLGFLSVTLYNFFFLLGMSRTSGSDATLIFAATPTLTIIISNFVLPDDKFSKKKLVGVALSFLGIVIIFLQGRSQAVPNRIEGNLFILGSVVVLAIYTVFSKPMFKELDIFTFSFWNAFYGWIFLSILVPINGFSYLTFTPFITQSSEVILALVYLAIFIIYATIAYTYGIKQLGPSRTSIFMNIVPIFGILSSILILGESFIVWYIPSFILIFTGVYIINTTK